MSTAHAGGTRTNRDEEIRVYGHNNLFYWWPVWVTGFVLATLTFLDGHVMAIVPPGTQVETQRVLRGSDGEPHDMLVLPSDRRMPHLPGTDEGETEPKLRVAASGHYGVIFVGVILFVVLFTNFMFRGLASFIALVVLVMFGLFVAVVGLSNYLFHWLGELDIHMNAGGYLALSVPLFLMWLFSTFVYDRYNYLIVTHGQVRIRKTIGDAEIAVDATGLFLEKKRNDIFRHWLLGLGSGDLHVKTGAPANLDFELPNVLLIGDKLHRIQELLRQKQVT